MNIIFALRNHLEVEIKQKFTSNAIQMSNKSSDFSKSSAHFLVLKIFCLDGPVEEMRMIAQGISATTFANKRHSFDRNGLLTSKNSYLYIYLTEYFVS